MTADRQ